ncbi:MAG: hypothetical protein QM648_10615 [Solirubrobacterales bacterium]
MALSEHLSTLPADLSDALEREYSNVLEHFQLEEWDDAQVDAGRFAEAVLRYLQWKMSARYTAIDGKNKPNRKSVVTRARDDTGLPPSARLQIPGSVELMLDFRNNRNSAHLGLVDADRLDATCVLNLVTWSMAEIVRIETQRDAGEVQTLLDAMSARRIPIVEIVEGEPVVTDPNLATGDRALVLLYQHSGPIGIKTLREWTGYKNVSRWSTGVLSPLERAKLIAIRSDRIYLLARGTARAEELLSAGIGET